MVKLVGLILAAIIADGNCKFSFGHPNDIRGPGNIVIDGVRNKMFGANNVVDGYDNTFIGSSNYARGNRNYMRGDFN